jgi:hypothetical protein
MIRGTTTSVGDNLLASGTGAVCQACRPREQVRSYRRGGSLDGDLGRRSLDVDYGQRSGDGDSGRRSLDLDSGRRPWELTCRRWVAKRPQQPITPEWFRRITFSASAAAARQIVGKPTPTPFGQRPYCGSLVLRQKPHCDDAARDCEDHRGRELARDGAGAAARNSGASTAESRASSLPQCVECQVRRPREQVRSYTGGSSDLRRQASEVSMPINGQVSGEPCVVAHQPSGVRKAKRRCPSTVSRLQA